MKIHKTEGKIFMNSCLGKQRKYNNSRLPISMEKDMMMPFAEIDLVAFLFRL